jgi:hypothetical protein
MHYYGNMLLIVRLLATGVYHSVLQAMTHILDTSAGVGKSYGLESRGQIPITGHISLFSVTSKEASKSAQRHG